MEREEQVKKQAMAEVANAAIQPIAIKLHMVEERAREVKKQLSSALHNAKKQHKDLKQQLQEAGRAAVLSS